MTIDEIESDVMNDVDVAGLLCSRICHDLVSPVGAITNGLEVLEDDNDPAMREHALALIGMSADSATAKLKFMRIAFGASLTLGEEFPAQEIGTLAQTMIKGGRVSIDCSGLRGSLAKTRAKLLLNMILMGIETLPRGGLLTVRNSSHNLVVACAGTKATLPEVMIDILDGALDISPDHRSIVAYIARHLAEGLDWALTHQISADCVTLEARRQ